MHLSYLRVIGYGFAVFVRDGDVSIETNIDVFHHLSEDNAMGRRILDVVVMDVIVYHFMDPIWPVNPLI